MTILREGRLKQPYVWTRPRRTKAMAVKADIWSRLSPTILWTKKKIRCGLLVLICWCTRSTGRSSRFFLSNQTCVEPATVHAWCRSGSQRTRRSKEVVAVNWVSKGRVEFTSFGPSHILSYYVPEIFEKSSVPPRPGAFASALYSASALERATTLRF